MNDNILASASFALIAAVAVLATAQIVQAEIEIERNSVAAASTKPKGEALAVAQAAPVTLPQVVVTGRHVPAPTLVAGSPLVVGAVDIAAAS
jgi:hypothetical protein